MGVLVRSFLVSFLFILLVDGFVVADHEVNAVDDEKRLLPRPFLFKAKGGGLGRGKFGKGFRHGIDTNATHCMNTIQVLKSLISL
ncbi:hypothetical protein PTKIN_Ptkin09bG0222100 [Pterospermum kingtungense]